jgi:hypothetical protein
MITNKYSNPRLVPGHAFQAIEKVTALLVLGSVERSAIPGCRRIDRTSAIAQLGKQDIQKDS